MKKKYLIMIMILIVLVSGCGKKKTTNNSNKQSNSNEIKSNTTNDINVVTSLEDIISNDTSWCGTFNLVWNELKENYVKQDIIINPPKEIVTNLNKSTFNKKYLDENSYYTKFGKQTPSLKKEIEENIKKKFNQNSDVLDNFKWEENSKTNFIYAMLYKKFTFETPFKQLKNSTFNDDKGSYRYFGIDSENRDGVNQLEVLYYDDYDNNAIKITTKENDEIILVKNTKLDNNFLDIYNNTMNNAKEYKDNKKFNDKDTLMVPYIKYDIYKEFTELEGLSSKYADGTDFTITKAIQTIKMQLSESGGDIKSEAVITTKENAVAPESKPEKIRYFNYNTSFVMFLKEKDSDLPYYAAYINDLAKYQKN